MSADFYRVLFDHSSDAHFIMNEGQIIDCNHAAIEILGCSRKEDVLHIHPVQLSPERQMNGESSREASKRQDAIAREKGWNRFEWTHQKVDGTQFPVEVTLNSISIDGKAFTLVVWHDLTERNRRENELKAISDALQAANAKMMEDLEAAAVVQRSLLPRADWREPGLLSTWTYQPSEELGGDILNIFNLAEGVVGFYCLDVAGHGVEASLMAVTASHLLSPNSHHSLVKNREGKPVSPCEVLHRLNQEFLFQEGRPQFSTITYGIFYLHDKKVTYACGGHPGPVHVLKTGEVRRLDHAGFIIGMLPQAKYEEHELYLQEGDRLYVYSDGVPEAQNPEGKFFETERLLEVLASNQKQGLSVSVEEVTLAVKMWCRPDRARDDISLLGFELESSL